MTRYLKRPSVGTHIAHRTGTARVLSSSDNGRSVTVVDATGRTFTETRDPAGCWVRADKPLGGDSL